MDRSELKNLIEDVTDIAVQKVVGPIDKRLTKIETIIEMNRLNNKRQRDTFWKIITLTAAVPACLYTVLNLFGLV